MISSPKFLRRLYEFFCGAIGENKQSLLDCFPEWHGAAIALLGLGLSLWQVRSEQSRGPGDNGQCSTDILSCTLGKRANNHVFLASPLDCPSPTPSMPPSPEWFYLETLFIVSVFPIISGFHHFAVDSGIWTIIRMLMIRRILVDSN